MKVSKYCLLRTFLLNISCSSISQNLFLLGPRKPSYIIIMLVFMVSFSIYVFLVYAFSIYGIYGSSKSNIAIIVLVTTCSSNYSYVRMA